MYGASGDAHLRSEVSGACRDLSFVLEALWRSGRVYIYRHLRAEFFFARSERIYCESSVLRINQRRHTAYGLGYGTHHRRQ